MAGTYARKTEVLVLGGGPGGYMAAIRAGQLGKKVLLVEKRELGGECLNRGCIPSKALIHASLLYHALRTEGPEVGVRAPDVVFDLRATMNWKQQVVAKERQGVATLLKSAGATVLAGEGRFTGPHTADLTAPDGGHERVDFESAVIATGAIPSTIPGFETDGERVVNAWELLDATTLPKSMLILGGGVSGCELGEFLARVGVAVTIVELLPQILPGLEADLSRELSVTLERLGVKVLVGTKAVGLQRDPASLTMTVERAQGRQELSAERLFVTVGKRPASRDLGLEDAGVTADAKTGFIPVDDRMRTNQPHIYAVGDVARPPMLAHKSYREGVVAAEAIAGLPTRFQFRAMPSVVFTTPELATVGLSTSEAESHGHSPREARFPYAALGRAHASHATQGWVKIVADEGTGALLGVHAAGERSGEFIAEAAHAIEMGATVRDLALTIHPHPTFSESMQEAALLWLGEPMHVARDGGPMPAVVDWGRRDYAASLEEMRRMARERRDGRIGDTLILVEHPPVVTVGVEGDDGDAARSGLPVVAVERGGRGTYHGPGQLVGYPIVDLDPRGRDVRRFVHETEALVVDALAAHGVRAGHVSGRHGVWVDGERKIASIGIAVERWVTFHGFALNVDLDMSPFEQFQPCGLSGSLMTSLARELGHPVTVDSVKPAVILAWNERFGVRPSSPGTSEDASVALTVPPPA